MVFIDKASVSELLIFLLSTRWEKSDIANIKGITFPLIALFCK